LPTQNLAIMFADIKGFTARVSRGKREDLKQLLSTHERLLAPVITHYEGTIVKTIGDAFLARFHSPRDAVLCGVTTQEVLRQHNAFAKEEERLEVRVAINAGDVELIDGDVAGEVVNLAARLEGIAAVGEVYRIGAMGTAVSAKERSDATMRKAPGNLKAAKAGTGRRKTGASATGFELLEKNILLSKGVTEAQIRTLTRKGIRCRDDFRRVGDAATLSALSGFSLETSAAVMSWALGIAAQRGSSIVIDSGDLVYCVHCGTKQPKDYKSGDLCGSCGKQAEPIMACFWCASTGPGKYCRQCGAEYVPTGELELAILLKREGMARDEIPHKLSGLSHEEKNVLWGRARRHAR